MRPTKDRVLIERVAKEETKKGSLLLLNEKPNNKFTVIGVGKDVKIDIQKGDIVMIDAYGLNPVVTDDGKELFIVKEEHIYLVL